MNTTETADPGQKAVPAPPYRVLDQWPVIIAIWIFSASMLIALILLITGVIPS